MGGRKKEVKLEGQSLKAENLFFHFRKVNGLKMHRGRGETEREYTHERSEENANRSNKRREP